MWPSLSYVPSPASYSSVAAMAAPGRTIFRSNNRLVSLGRSELLPLLYTLSEENFALTAGERCEAGQREPLAPPPDGTAWCVGSEICSLFGAWDCRRTLQSCAQRTAPFLLCGTCTPREPRQGLARGTGCPRAGSVLRRVGSSERCPRSPRNPVRPSSGTRGGHRRGRARADEGGHQRD